MSELKKIKIYIDTREKDSWNFEDYDCENIKLDTGDYYVENIPDMVVERKKTTSELATNLGKKWKPFEAELKRMSNYKYAYIICEFPIEYLDIFPEKSGMPKNMMSKVRMHPNFIKSRFFSSCNQYNIIPLFYKSAEEAKEAFLNLIKSNGILE